MNIALICTEKLPIPPIAGGAIQLYIEGILPYISPFHNITVFGIAHPDLPSEEMINGIKYVRVAATNKNEYLANLKLKLNNDFDLIHVFNRPLNVLYLAESLPHTKFSLSLHNEMLIPKKISSSKAIKCINRVEFINTVSKFIADGVKKLYHEAGDKLNVVYSGADINKYKVGWSEEGEFNKSELKKKYNIQKHKVVLFVGRLGEKKGAHILLKAMKEVMDTYDKVALVVVGSKWYGKNEIDEYTRSLQILAKRLKGPIIFTGFIPPSEITPYFNLGDIFVCPSQWQEPLARVHYEAMAAGLPIITTNRGGNAEVVSEYENGIVIDDFSNYKAFAEKIRFLLDNPNKALEYGKIGRKLAEEKFNWERVAREVFSPLFSLKSVEDVAQDKNELVEVNIEEVNQNNVTEVSIEEVGNDGCKEHVEERYFDVDF